MPEIDRREFDLLLDEKKHVDGQISSFLDLEIKLLAFLFPALGVAIGWMFNDRLHQDVKAEILVGAAASACFGILMSIGAYATAVAYINYKTVVLGAKFKKVLDLKTHPFETRHWLQSRGGKVLNATTGVLWLLVLIFTISLLVAAWCMSSGGIHLLISLCGVLLAAAVVLAMFLGRAILTAGEIPKD